jgi:predicted O-linked N-acetylglucosamine transferase (SPINDLY family)
MAGRAYLEVAQELRRLEIDIAVDLNAHTRDCFIDIFAYRPAPVQVNFLGFPGTVGAGFMDYILADATVLPMAEQPHISERIVQLPDCYQPNDTRRLVAGAVPSRAEAGLPEKGFVFACFNHSWKITPPVFALWMRLLAQVPDSVLWLMETLPEAGANLRAEAARHGIAPGRLVFAPRLPLEQHLARHALADLFVDTLPYNAHTTASDALWAGLPVVTCAGQSFPSRVGASLLRSAGLPELITHSLAEYEALALALVRDPARLASLRQKLAAQRDTCALFDLERYRRGIEAAFVRMWETAGRGEAPQAFAVRDLPSWNS